MSDLLNSNKSAPADSLFIILGISLSIPVILASFNAINPKIFKRYPKILFGFLFISAFLFSLWISMYGSAWIQTRYPNNSVDNDYLINFYSLSVLPLFLFLALMTANLVTEEKKSYSELLFISIIFGIISYIFLGISYYLNIAARNNNGFPLSASSFRGFSVHFNENQDIYRGVGYGILGVISLALVIMYYYFISRHEWLKDSPKIQKFIGYLAIIFPLILVLYAAVVESFVSLPDNVTSQNEYSVWLIISSFVILACILISLFTIARTNFISRKESNFYNGFIFSLGSISLILSICNIIFSIDQKVANNTFDDGTDSSAKLTNGINIKEHNENSYNLLNFAMGYNYLATGILSLLILFVSGLSAGGDRKILFKTAEFFSLKSKFKYDWYSGLLLLSVIFITGISIFFGIRFGEDNDNAFNINSKNSDGIIPLTATLLVLFFSYLIEAFSNLGNKEEEQSTFVLKVFHFLILLAILIIPVVCLVTYLISTPKFYNKVGNYTKDINLIFGDDKLNDNAVPTIDEQAQGESIFTVGSNFVNYGNGIFVTGGRTNLDLNTTRNIRYVSNQGSYYNSKFLYQGNDFKEIVNDDLNLFSLQTNQISYGDNDNDTNKAFWVAVGENVGLGNCIYYNTTAGANSNQNIPEIQELNNWALADSGSFNYKANGVISGVIGNGNRWVAVGQNDVDFSGTSNIKYSNNGRFWLNCTGTSFNGYGNKVAFGPSGLNISGGLKTNNTYIAVGYDTNNTNILRSTDGIDWTAGTGTLFDGEAKDIAYGLSGDSGTSGVWVAVGSDNNSKPIKYSLDDGVTWNNANGTIDFTKPNDANVVSYDLTLRKFYVGGKKGNTNVLYSSENGQDWEAETTYNNYDEITALGYNLQDARGNNNYDKVLYPPLTNQQFFVDKLESEKLKYFLFGNYISTFVLVLLTFLAMYYTTKDKYINTLVDK